VNRGVGTKGRESLLCFLHQGKVLATRGRKRKREVGSDQRKGPGGKETPCYLFRIGLRPPEGLIRRLKEKGRTLQSASLRGRKRGNKPQIRKKPWGGNESWEERYFSENERRGERRCAERRIVRKMAQKAGTTRLSLRGNHNNNGEGGGGRRYIYPPGGLLKGPCWPTRPADGEKAKERGGGNGGTSITLGSSQVKTATVRKGLSWRPSAGTIEKGAFNLFASGALLAGEDSSTRRQRQERPPSVGFREGWRYSEEKRKPANSEEREYLSKSI